jgi:hypothetical protein
LLSLLGLVRLSRSDGSGFPDEPEREQLLVVVRHHSLFRHVEITLVAFRCWLRRRDKRL